MVRAVVSRADRCIVLRLYTQCTDYRNRFCTLLFSPYMYAAVLTSSSRKVHCVHRCTGHSAAAGLCSVRTQASWRYCTAMVDYIRHVMYGCRDPTRYLYL